MNFHLWPLTGAELQLSRLSAATLLWLALFYSLVLLLVLLEPNNSWFRPLCHPSLRWLGSVSYAVYLFHQLISGLLHMLILQEAPYLASPAAAMVTFLALSVTLLLAEISRRWFDGPLINWGRRMNY
jgi:peptidoglycan/LPS O-acetylase OafA/YrhL